MDKKALKLALIRKIIDCEDEQVLQHLKDTITNLSPSESTHHDDLVAALLQDNKTVSGPTSEQDITDLQQSIDDIFG